MTTVLVVDDDASLLRMLALILRSEAYEVQTAMGAEEGLTVLDARQPDIVILDLNMPGMDGRAFYRRARAQGYDGPVVLCSAFGAPEARRELGAQAAIEKPFDPDQLVHLVHELVSTDGRAIAG
jgi:DNA-binding response OmpR family regulator